MAFRVGDIVQRRYGGGPRANVEKTTISGDNEWVTCVRGENSECHDDFAAEMLGGLKSPLAPESAIPMPGLPRFPWEGLCDRLTSWLRRW
jgi:hypothetical protein